MLLTREGKKSLQELLKSGCLERRQTPAHYDTLLHNLDAVRHYLWALDLAVRVDEVRGLVFVAVAQEAAPDGDEQAAMAAENALPDTENDEWSHPLVRRQRLTLEQSLLLAILRQRFVEVEQQQGIGHDDIRADWEDVKSQFFLYIERSGSDSKDNERLHNILRQLGEHGVVGKAGEEHIPIRPLIVHLANPDNLGRLLRQLQNLHDTQRETP